MEQKPHTFLLLVFSDKMLGSIFSEYLQHLGFDAKVVSDLQDGDVVMEMVRGEYPYILLAQNSNSDTLEMIQQIRDYSPLPLLVLMPEPKKADILSAYKMGADDVSLQPASAEVIACKIHALDNRINQTKVMPSTYEIGSLAFDTKTQMLKYPGGTEVKLSGKESEVLQLLASETGHLVNKSTILRKIWKADTYFNGRSLSVFINHLRKLLAETEDVSIIGVRGKGYKLVVAHTSDQ